MQYNEIVLIMYVLSSILYVDQIFTLYKSRTSRLDTDAPPTFIVIVKGGISVILCIFGLYYAARSVAWSGNFFLSFARLFIGSLS